MCLQNRERQRARKMLSYGTIDNANNLIKKIHKSANRYHRKFRSSNAIHRTSKAISEREFAVTLCVVLRRRKLAEPNFETKV